MGTWVYGQCRHQCTLGLICSSTTLSGFTHFYTVSQVSPVSTRLRFSLELSSYCYSMFHKTQRCFMLVKRNLVMIGYIKLQFGPLTMSDGTTFLVKCTSSCCWVFLKSFKTWLRFYVLYVCIHLFP